MVRKAMPTHLHLINDNKSHLTKKEIEQRQKAEESIQFKSDNIKPPSWLSVEGKRLFKKLIKEYEHNEILANVDVYLMSMYCDALADYIECSNIIKEEGLMMEHTNKAKETNRVPHPLLTKKKALFDQMNKIASDFGMSPTARARLAINLQADESDDDNKFSDRL